MSTVDNVFVLHGIINHLLSKGEKLFCASVDFTKAFDYVVRDILWYKLIKLGVCGKILNVIMSIGLKYLILTVENKLKMSITLCLMT